MNRSNPKPKTETKEEWLFFAESDLGAAKELDEHKYAHLKCFHAQQCVEKCLKAVLLNQGESTTKLHNLQELLEKVARREPRFLQFRKECARLDEFYKPTRYPDALPGALPEGLPDEKDAKKAIRIAEEILRFTKKVLKR